MGIEFHKIFNLDITGTKKITYCHDAGRENSIFAETATGALIIYYFFLLTHELLENINLGKFPVEFHDFDVKSKCTKDGALSNFLTLKIGLLDNYCVLSPKIS